jgi:uncharacterized short protein YbdD (DUF466 family)
MICRCFNKTLDFRKAARQAAQTARLMLGVPDYDSYLAHAETTHPNDPPLSKQDFFKNRQDARFSSARFRCC